MGAYGIEFYPSGISVIWLLKWSIAVSFSPAVCGISSFWLTVFGKRRSRYCGTVHCALLFNASLRSVSPSRAPVRIFKTLD